MASKSQARRLSVDIVGVGVSVHCGFECSCVVLLPLRRGGSPSFYRLRRGRFTGVPHCLATGGGMACSAGELAAILAVLAPVLSLRHVPYLNRDSFEGEGVVVGCGVLRRARGSR
jgi:hypothetical protein